MRPRIFGWLLLVVILVVGAPYIAMMMNRAMGPWNGTAVEHDGSITSIEFGSNLPRPSFIAVMPDAEIVQASRVINVMQHRHYERLEIATRESLGMVKKFYSANLAAAGFAIKDLGTAPMNAATAKYLGIAGQLMATRAATNDQVVITIHAPEGLLRATQVDLSWYKLPVNTPRQRPS